MVFTRTFRQWAGRRRQGDRIGRVDHFIKHTEAGADMPADATIEMEARRLRAIDALHKTRFGKRGFGYSWASFPSGRVYEGRGEHRSGAHTVGFNHSSLASMHAGHGDRTPMTPAAIHGDRKVIAHMQTRGAISRKYRVSGHRDHAAKSCPGNRIYPQLGELRGVTPNGVEGEEEDVISKDENSRGTHVTVLCWRLNQYFHRGDHDPDEGGVTVKSVVDDEVHAYIVHFQSGCGYPKDGRLKWWENDRLEFLAAEELRKRRERQEAA